MQQDIIIDRRFNGPPDSGNGGYVSGRLAAYLPSDEPVTVSLKAPPPLDKRLTVQAHSDHWTLAEGDTVVAVAAPGAFTESVPADLAAARDLPRGQSYRDRPADLRFVPFDQCFVCGRSRRLSDGLCIRTHPVIDRENLVIADFVLDDNFAAPDGRIDPVYLWSALDCPGYDASAPGEPALLARITAEITASVKPGEQITVFGWSAGASGRKRKAGTALLSQAGHIIARSEQLWIVIDPERVPAGQRPTA